MANGVDNEAVLDLLRDAVGAVWLWITTPLRHLITDAVREAIAAPPHQAVNGAVVADEFRPAT